MPVPTSRKRDALFTPLLFSETELSIGSPFLALLAHLGVATGPGWPDRLGTALQTWSARAIQRPIRTLSLFAGAGGLDIGFHDAGFDILEMVEINPAYSKTLSINAAPDGYFHRGLVSTIDIRDYDPRSWLRVGQPIDLIIGGPPCQTFSAAGRRAAGVPGTTEKRGVLFEEYVRILEIVRPKAFIFENVYGITGAEGGEAWQRIHNAFASAGYHLFFRILDSADYGVPQHRERMIVVGVGKGSFRFPRPTHGPDSPGSIPFTTAREAIYGLSVSPHEARPLTGRYGTLLRHIPPGLNYSFFTEKMGHPKPLFAWRSKFSDFLYKADPNWPVRTVKAFCGQYTGPFHWTNRRFTVAELKRLQTFPDTYSLAGSTRTIQQQIGNSVPPQMARILALAVLHQVFNVPLPAALPLLSEADVLHFRRRKRALVSEYKRRATAALKQNRPRRTTAPRSLSFTADLTDNFRFTYRPTGLPYSVKIDSDDNELRVTISRRPKHAASFSIDVTPNSRGLWALPVHRILLQANALTEKTFVIVWKACEVWLSKTGLKDDWVQLNNYFAYRPSITCSMSILRESSLPAKDRTFWRVVRSVVAGIGVRTPFHQEDLAQIWSVASAGLPNILGRLRRAGYEVRSSKTNPQLPSDTFLVPYSFPTFTHRSVQLFKDLY